MSRPRAVRGPYTIEETREGRSAFYRVLDGEGSPTHLGTMDKESAELYKKTLEK